MRYITINGEEYPVKLTFRVLTHFGKKYKKTKLSDVQGAMDAEMEDLPEMILRSVKAGCQIEGVDCNLRKEDVLDALDQDFQLMQKFLEGVPEDMGIKPLDDADADTPQPKAAKSGN